MPVSNWSELKGIKCLMCDGPATHWYPFPFSVCCDCHAGKDGGLFDSEQAQRIHEGRDPIDWPEAEAGVEIDHGERPF